jgi:hypothetical protein
MGTTIVAGRASVAVNDSAEVDLLSSDALGINIARSVGWRLVVNTTQDISVRVYLKAGANCGFSIVSGYTTLVTSATPLVLSESEWPAQRIRVTAQATTVNDATVNCDFLAISSMVN